MKENQIIVNLTTYKERECYAEQVLKNFVNQSLTPDKIILWLSEEEYKGIIPDNFKQCLDEGLLTDINFVEGDTKSHKKNEWVNYYNDCYNITIDDDKIYPETLVEELFEFAKEHKDCITTYLGRRCLYNKYRRIIFPLNENIDTYIKFLSCYAIYPPNTFPLESLKYKELRDKYVLYSDECWLNAFILKTNIKYAAIYPYKYDVCKEIKEAQGEHSLYYRNCLNPNNKIPQRSILQANAIKIAGCEKEWKELHPLFDFESLNTINK